MNDEQDGLSDRVDAAFQATVETVIEKARQSGTPVIVWEQGRIKEIPSDQLEHALKQRLADTSTPPASSSAAPTHS